MTLNSRELDNDKDDDGEPHVCVVAAAQATEMKDRNARAIDLGATFFEKRRKKAQARRSERQGK